MEVYLVDGKPFRLTAGFLRAEYNMQVYSSCKFTLEPLARYYCRPLLDGVSVSLLNAVGDQDKNNPTLKLQLVTPHNHDNDKSRVQICSGDGVSVLGMIREWCGEDNVRISLKLSKVTRSLVGGFDIEAKDLPIKDLSQDGNLCGYGCELILSRPIFDGHLTVSMKLTQGAVDSLLLKKFVNSNLAGGNKRLLEDAVCSDLVILAANGTEIKCHKAMLAVRSDVFKAMFENKMKESITSVVEMPDMSEQAVRSFLGFIYCEKIKDALGNCDIALDLLIAADKYHVPDLISAIVELITAMPNEWFDLEMSLKLLIFTERQREIGENKNLEQLQEKTIGVLKSHNKVSFDLLLNSEVYQQLFRKNPETAMKISARFLFWKNQQG